MKMKSASRFLRAGRVGRFAVSAFASWFMFAWTAHSSDSFQIDPMGLGNRKVIVAGWEFNHLRLEDFLANAEALDRTVADGFVLAIPDNPSVGRNFGNATLMTEPLWREDLLEDVVQQLKEMAKHKSMRHSFLKGLKVPTDLRLDWRDDRAWAIVSNNVSTVAKIARRAGLPGIHMDVEDYWRKRQFFHIETDPPIKELRKMARQRGREIFTEVFRAYPDITVFSYFGVSAIFFMQQERSAQALSDGKRDILPAFINGMLDVMPPTARFVEGMENAYQFDYAKKDFLTAKTRIYNWYLPLIEPENRAKYLSQVSMGFGLFLDMYVNGKDNNWHFGDIGGSRLEYLRRNAAQALSATDEYIWFWGERGMWIDWNEQSLPRVHKGARKGRWDRLIPGGLNECLAILKDPSRNLLPKIEKAIAGGELKDIIGNPSCSFKTGLKPGVHPDRLPSPYMSWQRNPPKGTEKSLIGTDATVGDGDLSSLFIKGVNGGCVHFSVDSVKPGGYYYVKARVKGAGAWPTIGFRHDKKWLEHQTVFLPMDGDDIRDWRTVRTCVRVPDTATFMSLSLGVSRLGPSETVWYDNVSLYELPDELVTGVKR